MPFSHQILSLVGQMNIYLSLLHFPQLPRKNFQGISTCIPTYSTSSCGKAVRQVSRDTRLSSQADGLEGNRDRLLRGRAASCKAEKIIFRIYFPGKERRKPRPRRGDPAAALPRPLASPRRSRRAPRTKRRCPRPRPSTPGDARFPSPTRSPATAEQRGDATRTPPPRHLALYSTAAFCPPNPRSCPHAGKYRRTHLFSPSPIKWPSARSLTATTC